MINNTISIKEIIRRVVTNLRMQEEEILWDEIIEWICDGLEHIGAYYQFCQKETKITIEDYKGSLPSDFYKELRILNHDLYDYHNPHLIIDADCETDKSKQVLSNRATGFDYKINLNAITTAYKTGELTLQYLAFPTDEEGLPLVPDSVSFKDALFWKVAYHLSLSGYPFKNQQLSDINFTKGKWETRKPLFGLSNEY